jgi:probable HAF family extracellular repeat protein
MKLAWIKTGLSGVLLVLLLAGNVRAQQYYTMSLLGFAPFSPTINGMNGINNNGDVVGFDSAINGAFFDHNGTVSSLGMTSGVGVAINSGGYVAVRSWGSDLHSYLYTPGRLPWFVPRFTDLGTLGGSGGLNNSGQTIALAMNDSRTIVGESTVTAPSLTWHAFSWSAGHMTDLGVLSPGGQSTARAINNLGQIVGDSFGTDTIDRAFQMVNGVMTDLDPANHNYDSSAVAINNSGQIVVTTNLAWRLIPVLPRGWRHVAYRGPITYTQIYSNGTFTDIGDLGYNDNVYGYGINSAGDVVGFANDPVDGHIHGFLYHAGSMTDLNDVVVNLNGWRISLAYCINDYGTIVAWVYNDSLQQFETAVLMPIFD